jgi:hypothetical protein
MITARTFTREWLESVNARLGMNRSENQFVNMEKAIAALYLLEQLQAIGLPLQFRGGTSLLLVFNRIYRLSTDVDIVVSAKAGDMEAAFEGVCSKSALFNRFDRQRREDDSKTGAAHYRFFYEPFADDRGGDAYVLLDVTQADGLFPLVRRLPVNCDLLENDGDDVSVAVPRTESLLADKLTTFAPTTIGIPLVAEKGKRPKRVEALKQLFDLGNLFEVLDVPVPGIREECRRVAEYKIASHHKGLTADDVLADTFHNAVVIAFGGMEEPGLYAQYEKGFRDFSRFTASLAFAREDAALAAAKVAYLCKLIEAGPTAVIERYAGIESIVGLDFSSERFYRLSPYRLTNPKAFFYLQKLEELLTHQGCRSGKKLSNLQ